jgi:HK97 family phage major capsid protein
VPRDGLLPHVTDQAASGRPFHFWLPETEAMETIQQKRERRNALAKEARNLLDTVKGADWQDEHQAKYDQTLGEIERVDNEIQREQKLLDLQAERTFEDMGGKERDLDKPENQVAAIYDKFLRRGERGISDEEWALIRNTMSTTTDAEGGYTVPTLVAEQVLEAMKAFGGMREEGVATVIQTARGEPMTYPTSDGTSEEGEIVAENASATDADPSFGVKNLNVFKFGSKVITVPIELLQDSAVDVEAFVRARIVQRLGRITNKKFTIGAGTTEPDGIVPQAGAGKVGASGQTATIIYDDLVDLEHSVDPAYRGSGRCRWMMHDSSLKVIRKLKDGDGRPVFLPSYDAGIRGGVPAELLGYPITINQNVPVMAAEAKSVLFGDFSYYIIRDAMAMTMFRFTDSAYAKKGQVGFLAWMRSGGNFVDVGGAVKHYANAAS